MLDTNTTIVTTPVSVRLRRSPFWPRSHAAGGHNYTSYNHTLIAADFKSPEEDYRHLKSAVQLWDVGCERQIELRGPDAKRLAQAATPRDLDKMADDQCFYIPTVDAKGGMTNDPVLIKVDEDHYWVSVADSDLILFFKGVAAAMRLDVCVDEVDVWPLGIQGPKAAELARRVWGDDVMNIRFFRHKRMDVNGVPMLLARSGYSTQGGFELYFEGRVGASALWDQLMAMGSDLDVQAGSPCQSERVESGMLSYLSDITPDMTPFEAGLGKFCEMTRDVGCLGWRALREGQEPMRQIRPIEISGGPLPPMREFWRVISELGETVGRISSACRAWSYDCNAAIGLIGRSHWQPGTKFTVETSDGPRSATVRERFWNR